MNSSTGTLGKICGGETAWVGACDLNTSDFTFK